MRMRRGKLTQSKKRLEKENMKDTIKHQTNNKKDQKEVSMGRKTKQNKNRDANKHQTKGAKRNKISNQQQKKFAPEERQMAATTRQKHITRTMTKRMQRHAEKRDWKREGEGGGEQTGR